MFNRCCHNYLILYTIDCARIHQRNRFLSRAKNFRRKCVTKKMKLVAILLSCLSLFGSVVPGVTQIVDAAEKTASVPAENHF